jgi:hypothetical protein
MDKLKYEISKNNLTAHNLMFTNDILKLGIERM